MGGLGNLGRRGGLCGGEAVSVGEPEGQGLAWSTEKAVAHFTNTGTWRLREAFPKGTPGTLGFLLTPSCLLPIRFPSTSHSSEAGQCKSPPYPREGLTFCSFSYPRSENIKRKIPEISNS